ncbi:ABC transporter permease [Ruixingdingia sedimenti]|uniref:ABC transporter permease n=1 Tax=Ruixingdingia sedimenti TaxID=3073604 RepID=A0ABU1F7E1_9RHOB|nr:ABC transporter permease [Xinfangfangia sp. LG-4]MDR5652568.1 ABC transporter permease [Xinfangfangia sp. LG-4]
MTATPSKLRLFLRRPSGIMGLALLAAIAAMALVAGYVFPEGPTRMVSRPLLWPGERPGLPFGTDRMGSDIMAGIMYGARASILVGLAAAAVSIVVGTLVGAVSGYYRGWADDVLMRVTDAVQTIPSFLAAVVIVGVIGPSLTTVIISISIVSWPIIARLVRAEFLRLRNYDFVHSCRIIGMSDARIILTQILPNCLSSIVVASSVLVATAIIVEAGLSFLGLGDPNVISWGSMIGAGRSVLRAAWYITLIPAGFVVVTVLSINLIGDALNDALNPRLRER